MVSQPTLFYIDFSGSADSQYQYGMCLLNGDGVDEDAEKATEFFQMAAEQNMPQAQVRNESSDC